VARRDWNFILYFRRDEAFACKNGWQCLPITKVCDGARHCLDASDESTEMCNAREYVLQSDTIRSNLNIFTLMVKNEFWNQLFDRKLNCQSNTYLISMILLEKNSNLTTKYLKYENFLRDKIDLIIFHL